MKFADNEYIETTGSEGRRLIEAWRQEAQRIMIERGVYVLVAYEETHLMRLTRIYFKALGREFECTHDLYKVLNNKAFL